MQRGHYMFPDITVCFYETAGCDQDYIDFCTESPILLDLPRSATTYVGFEVDEQALRAKKSTVSLVHRNGSHAAILVFRL